MTSAPLNVKYSIDFFKNFPSLDSTYTPSNFPFGVNAKEATFPTVRPYSSLIGLPIERKRLELLIMFFSPYFSNSLLFFLFGRLQ